MSDFIKINCQNSSKLSNILKIFVSRKIPEKGIEMLKEHFDIIQFYPKEERIITKDELINNAKGCDGLLCLLTDKIDSQVMDQVKMKVIANYAVGFDNINIPEATKRGIPVTNTPGVLTAATADLTWSLLLSVARNIVESDKFVRSGKWKGWSPTMLMGSDLENKTLGIVGFGRIGQAVAKRATGFGMNIIYSGNTPKPEAEKQFNAKMVPLEELLKTSDFVSLHCSYSPSTHHLISKKELSLMKPTSYLINTSRGKVIDEKELIEALKEKKIQGAGLDVFYNEPQIDIELTKLDNVIILPHLGSATIGTRSKMAQICAENLIDFLIKKQKPRNLVNKELYKN